MAKRKSKPTTVTNWRELSAAINSIAQTCSGGFCEPVGTLETRKTAGGIVKMVISVDLIPGQALATKPIQITDEDIPF